MTFMNQQSLIGHHGHYTMPSMPVGAVSSTYAPVQTVQSNFVGANGHLNPQNGTGFVDMDLSGYYMNSVSNFAAYQPPSYGK